MTTRIVIQDSEPIEVDCDRYGGLGTVGDGYCMDCYGNGSDYLDLACLVRNVAIAGALCAAFRDGWIVSEAFGREPRDVDAIMYECGGKSWEPGCGRARSAPCAVVLAELRCDAPGCDARHRADNAQVLPTRTDAVSNGWSHRILPAVLPRQYARSIDLCPVCSALQEPDA